MRITRFKIIIVIFMITTTFLFTGCGKEVDNVINEMTLKGTVDRGMKTINKVKGFQKQYIENLKDYQAFDNPTNTVNTNNQLNI